jgi:hypothetical protein
MAKLVCFIIVIMFLGNCQNNSPKTKQSKISNNDMNLSTEKIDFITYHTKDKIPQFLLDSLTIINGSKFEIGDSTDIKNISFSDAKLQQYKYNRMLYFVSLSDNISIIAYKQGGIGTHDVIDIFFNKTNTHKRYLSNDNLSSLDRVINFINNTK